jgi:hypothetical protein
MAYSRLKRQFSHERGSQVRSDGSDGGNAGLMTNASLFRLPFNGK